MSETAPISPRRPAGTSFPLVVACMAALAATAYTLDIQTLLDKRLGMDSEGLPAMNPEPAGGALDNSIDPDRYLVGGGDGFQIAIQDLPSQEYSPVVKSDGNMYIPEFGPIKLGRIPLSQAIPRIESHVRASLKRNYKVYVTLSRAKTATVILEGAASNPGTYRLPGTQRILDLLKQANEGRIPDSEIYDLRRVAVRNRDSLRTYDLLSALAGKGADQNPYVYPGDRVELRNQERTLCVAGEVLSPVKGQIPLVPGETARDILSLLSFKGSADTAYFLLGRNGEPSRKIPWEEAGSVALSDRDVLVIPSRGGYARMDTVQVTGEVLRPGTYPIVWGRTTAAEVIGMAGGPTDRANPRRGFVVRSNVAFNSTPRTGLPLQAGRLEAPQFGSPSVRPEIAAGLSHLASSNDFAVIEIKDRPESIPLEDGDEVRIPPKEHYVYVSGSVRNPGAYPYQEGKGLGHYVSLAGGYSSQADPANAVVVSRFKNFTRVKGGANPQEGDVVMVPASVENKRLSMIYLPLVQTLATVLSLGLSFYILVR